MIVSPAISSLLGLMLPFFSSWYFVAARPSMRGDRPEQPASVLHATTRCGAPGAGRVSSCASRESSRRATRSPAIHRQPPHGEATGIVRYATLSRLLSTRWQGDRACSSRTASLTSCAIGRSRVAGDQVLAKHGQSWCAASGCVDVVGSEWQSVKSTGQKHALLSHSARLFP